MGFYKEQETFGIHSQKKNISFFGEAWDLFSELRPCPVFNVFLEYGAVSLNELMALLLLVLAGTVSARGFFWDS